MKGKCLCGEVEFAVSGTLPNLYQCHCSQCRKSTGSASNTALIVPSRNFQWISGQEHVASFVKDNGYRSDFCSKCGSPLPNLLKGREEFWIPAGLLEGNLNTHITVHLHVASKASWDTCVSSGVNYQEAPDLENLMKVLMNNPGA